MTRSLRLPPMLPDDVSADRLDASEEESGESDGFIHDDDLTEDDRKRLKSMEAIDGGETRASQAEVLDLTAARVGQLYRRYKRYGRRGVKRWGTRDLHGSRLPAKIKQLARRKLIAVPAMSAAELAEDPDMAALCVEEFGSVPRPRRFKRLIEELAVTDPNIGRSPTSRGRATVAEAAGFTAFWDRPGFLEYDEETTNLLAQYLPGLPFTDREHSMLAKDIATKSPAGLVCSSQTMDQGDLRSLILRITRPKDELVERAGAKGPWPVCMLAFMLRGDNAWINSALMFILSLPLLGILLEFAPAKRPEKKGVAESGIGQGQKISQNHQPNSTKSDPRRRGRADPGRFAAKHGISGLDIENDQVRIAVDGIGWGWDRRARTRPFQRYQVLTRKYPVRTYEGDQGTLVRLLKSPIGTRRVGTHGISYNGDDYVAEWGGDPDTDPRNELPYHSRRRGFLPQGKDVKGYIDHDDVRMMDVYDLDGTFLGTAVCNRIGAEYGRAVPRFELDVRKVRDAKDRQAGLDSRASATAEVLQGNQRRPTKQVAQTISHQIHIARRHQEAAGKSPSARSRARKRKEVVVAIPVAKPVFTRTDAAYRKPTIRVVTDRAAARGPSSSSISPTSNQPTDLGPRPVKGI